MKKAVVVGGSNGIGLAIAENLIRRGWRVIVLDRCEGDCAMLPEGGWSYVPFDLLEFDGDVLAPLAADPDVGLLMVTAGVGRVADFEYFHTAEIERTLTVDTVSTLKLFRVFYDRIRGGEPFYAGVMGSIAGWMSSPSAALYAAAKAGVVRFVESVNIELEAAGVENRILDVSPASFKGSRFYGAENDLAQLSGLAEDIVTRLLARETRFIPQYEETFRAVLERYHDDPHGYGLHSYRYKHESGRLDNQKRVVIGYLSGTFDLFHVGHLNLLRRAKRQCDYLIVGVHDSGKWKGKETFIPLDERKAIVGACRYVDRVVDACVEDSDAWDIYHYDRLFVGSDYQGTERFRRYEAYFADKGVKIVYFPYTQGTSSTQIRNLIVKRTKEG